jgi:TolB-like protein
LQFDRFTLDLKRGCVRAGARDITLAPKPFEVLRCLAENAGLLVSKRELFAAVWPNAVVTDDSLVQCIRELRDKLGDIDHRLIKTVPRRGYLLDVPVVPTDAASEPLPAAIERSAEALPDRPSLAVLPFSNMSGDPDQDYLAEGIAEDIITALSHCASLLVIARNSSFAYKGKNTDVRQIGRELGVRYLVEGSVQRAGNRLRITAQVVDTNSGAHIWADQFDGGTSEMFEFQDRITASVAAAVEPKLQAAEIKRSKSKRATDLDAYDLLLRAQALEHEFTDESLTKALHLLKRAIAMSPSYAHAMALAAFCYCQRRSQGWSKNPDVDKAEGTRFAILALEHGRSDANVCGWCPVPSGYSEPTRGAQGNSLTDLCCLTPTRLPH